MSRSPIYFENLKGLSKLYVVINPQSDLSITTHITGVFYVTQSQSFRVTVFLLYN